MKNFKLLLKSVREYKLPSILTILSMIIEVGMEIFLPFLMSKLVDHIQDINKTLDGLWIYVVLLIVMSLISMGAGFLGGYFGAKASTGFAKNLRDDVFKKVQSFSFENIDHFSQSSLITRITTDITNIQNSYQMSIRIIIRAPLMFIFALVMAFILGGSLAITFLVLIPFIGLGLALIIRKALPVFRRVFKKYDKLNQSVQENISGIRVVKSYVREDFENKKFSDASDDMTNDFIKANKILAFQSPIMNGGMYLCTLLVCGIGAYLIVSTFGGYDANGNAIWGALSTGQLSALLNYGVQILMSLMIISMIFVMFTMSIESMNRVVEVLNEQQTITNPENPIYEVADGSVSFKNVSFKYNEKAERNALENINIQISSGETIGIIGTTGAGKTTLISLISRLYDVGEGEVFVGGKNVKEYDLVTLRDNVSVVLQQNLLFSGTVESNLRWGNPNATSEEIVEACKIACADEFIEISKDKYQSVVDQGGNNFSGGQKQRLCIARALIKKPKILILDDSTSAVDTKTDAIIREGFKNYIPSTTKIIIAQRINSVMDADRIFVIDNGKIINQGTHDELLKNCAEYQEIYSTQNKLGGK